jgi:hypothetical protein
MCVLEGGGLGPRDKKTVNFGAKNGRRRSRDSLGTKPGIYPDPLMVQHFLAGNYTAVRQKNCCSGELVIF